MSLRKNCVQAIAFGACLATLSLASSSSAQDVARRRLGIQIDVGAVNNANTAAGVGFAAAFGIQSNDVFASYYQPRVLFGGYVSGDNGSGFIALYNTLMFDFTIADTVLLGAGPSLDIGTLAVCGVNSCNSLDGAYFGADFRIALAFGERNKIGGRQGFVFSLNAHPTWIGNGDVATSVSVGAGYQYY